MILDNICSLIKGESVHTVSKGGHLQFHSHHKLIGFCLIFFDKIEDFFLLDDKTFYKINEFHINALLKILER